MTKPKTVAEYIETAAKQAQEKLRELGAILKKVTPKATETLKWGSPVLGEDRILSSFAAYKSHLDFMPTRPAMANVRGKTSVAQAQPNTYRASPCR